MTDKTETLLFSFLSSLKPSTRLNADWQNRNPSLSLFIFFETFHRFPRWLDYSSVALTTSPSPDSARNLGIILVVTHTCPSRSTSHHKNLSNCLFNLNWHISSIRRRRPQHGFSLSEDSTKTLVTSYIFSRLDYCGNCLLMGTPNSVIPLSRKFKTQLLQDTFFWYPATGHWPLSQRNLSWINCTGFPFQYKVACMYFSAILKMVPSGLAFLSELLPRACLHSVSYTTRFFWLTLTGHMLKNQQYKRKTHGFRTFSCFGPHIWNSLPQDLRHCSAHTPSIAFQHFPPKEGCRKPVLGVCAQPCHLLKPNWKPSSQPFRPN